MVSARRSGALPHPRNPSPRADWCSHSAGGAALIKCFRVVKIIFQRKIGHNLFRGGIIPLQHGQVPALQGHVSFAVGRNVLQEFAAGSGIAILNYFEISKVDLGIGADLQHPIVRGGSGRPVTHEKVIVAGVESDFKVARIEG